MSAPALVSFLAEPYLAASDTGYEVEVVFAYCLLGRREIHIF